MKGVFMARSISLLQHDLRHQPFQGSCTIAHSPTNSPEISKIKWGGRLARHRF